jgi:hypothetical protein
VTTGDGAARAVGIGTGIAGAVLVLRPRQISRRTRGSGLVPPPSIVRVLGSRYLIQGAVQTMWPRREVWKLSCAADVLHASTMVAAALARPQYRSAACASLLFAVTSATCTGALASRSRA